MDVLVVCRKKVSGLQLIYVKRLLLRDFELENQPAGLMSVLRISVQQVAYFRLGFFGAGSG